LFKVPDLNGREVVVEYDAIDRFPFDERPDLFRFSRADERCRLDPVPLLGDLVPHIGACGVGEESQLFERFLDRAPSHRPRDESHDHGGFPRRSFQEFLLHTATSAAFLLSRATSISVSPSTRASRMQCFQSSTPNLDCRMTGCSWSFAGTTWMADDGM